MGKGVRHMYVHAKADVCPCRGGVYVHMINLIAELIYPGNWGIDVPLSQLS